MRDAAKVALILEPRFVVTRFADGAIRITAAPGLASGGSVLLSPEQARRVAEAILSEGRPS